MHAATSVVCRSVAAHCNARRAQRADGGDRNHSGRSVLTQLGAAPHWPAVGWPVRSYQIYSQRSAQHSPVNLFGPPSTYPTGSLTVLPRHRSPRKCRPTAIHDAPLIASPSAHSCVSRLPVPSLGGLRYRRLGATMNPGYSYAHF